MFQLRSLMFSVLALFASHAAAQTLSSTTVVSGFTQSLWCGHAPGDANRLFVVEQRRGVRLVDLAANGTGTLRTTPFLDLTIASLSNLLGTNGLEYGILGMAFHPDYQHNGYFYISCTPGHVGNTLDDYAIVRFKVNPADPNLADPASAQTVILVSYDIGNHRSGWLQFGNDGYLYFTTGDGGEGDPGNHAANKASLRGKLLRLDVDGPDNIPGNADDDGYPPATDNKNYTIPPTNPFINETGTLPEIFAYGLRNAWRASIDRATGDIWIGDVGQAAWEEVDRIPAGQSGYNFGWKCLEGTHFYSTCTVRPPGAIDPVYEYPHSGATVSGTSVTGGIIYRGCAIPALRGTYIFGDWGGKCWTSTVVNNTLTNVTSRAAELGLAGTTPVHFGENTLGEVYIACWGSNGAGHIRLIKPTTVQGPDCNANGKTDACDIATLISKDLNLNGIPDECEGFPCDPDFNHDGDIATDADIEAFFACIGGNCCPACSSADFNADGDTGTDADIESFFRVLGGSAC